MLILKGDIYKIPYTFSNNGHVKMVSQSSGKLDLVVYQYLVRILSVKLWERAGVKLTTPPPPPPPPGCSLLCIVQWSAHFVFNDPYNDSYNSKII